MSASLKSVKGRPSHAPASVSAPKLNKTKTVRASRESSTPQIPPRIAANPAKLARYSARKAAQKTHMDARKAARASGKVSMNKRPAAAAGTVALDLSPLIRASTNVPVYNVENADDFSAADKALFAKPAGADKTAVTMTNANENNASAGEFRTRNGRVNWGNDYGSLHFQARSGNLTEYDEPVYEGTEWEYNFGTYNDWDGLVVTRVEFVPLTRNGSGEIETFRVDLYKKILDAIAVFGDVEIPEGIFSTTQEKLAISVLVTERVVQNAYVQTDVRFLQSADEIALQVWLEDDGHEGYFSVYFNDGEFVPSGSVSDVQRQGLICTDTDNTPAAGWIDLDDDSNSNFELSGSTTKGLVYHTRIPLSFFTVTKPADTLGTPLPLWVMLLLLLALGLGAVSFVKVHRLLK